MAAPGEPVTELQERFSSPGAGPTPWSDGRDLLEKAEIYWLSTVRPDSRPHVTPLIAVWLDGSLYFCTGSDERKAKNLAANPRCVLTTGGNAIGEGLDVVVEGEAVRVIDEGRLRRLVALFETKYGPDWRFDVKEAAFEHNGGLALVFEVAPVTAFGFGKGEYSQTRWSFA